MVLQRVWMVFMYSTAKVGTDGQIYLWWISPPLVSRIQGLYRGPPRMEAGGQDSVDCKWGWLRQGGIAGVTSEDRQGLSRSTETFSLLLPISNLNNFKVLAAPLYGPLYKGKSGGPGAPRHTKTKLAAMRRWREPAAEAEDEVEGNVASFLVGTPAGGGRRKFSRKAAARGSSESTSSPGRARGTL